MIRLERVWVGGGDEQLREDAIEGGAGAAGDGEEEPG